MSAAAPPLSLLVNIPAWQRETFSLSASGSGALLALKMHLWRTGPIPDDNQALARITGMAPQEWKKTRKTLEPLFIVMHGEWQRIDWNDELESAYEAVNKASKAGKKANKARWEKQRMKSESDSESDTNRTPNALLNNKSDKPKSLKAPSQGNDGFRHGDDVVGAAWLEDLRKAEDGWIENDSSLAGGFLGEASNTEVGGSGPVVGFGGGV